MARGRKNGCPVNIRDWLVYILDKAQPVETWVRINGLTSLRQRISGTTEDGSAETDLWEEPYITKRSATLSLEGDPIVDAGTGEPDAGQEMLDAYAEEGGGCDGEATLKFIDPYGHTMVADYVVTDKNREADNTNNTISWELAQVGEPETLPYVQMESVAVRDAWEDDDFTWTLGKSIDADGSEQDNPYTALSQTIPVAAGDRVVRIGAIRDAGGATLLYRVNEYSNGVFTGRTEFLTSMSDVTIGDNTTEISITFGRYGSSGTNITQQDIDNYFGMEIIRHGVGPAVTEVSMSVGDAPKLLVVDFSPTNASNKRYKVSVSGKRVASVSSITEDSFIVTALSAGVATITAKTMNGNKTATVTVTVT